MVRPSLQQYNEVAFQFRNSMSEETPAAHQSETERSLRENERRLATLLSNLPGMAYRCKNDRDWTMKFVSGGCEALTGYKAIDLIGVGATTYNSLRWVSA